MKHKHSTTPPAAKRRGRVMLGLMGIVIISLGSRTLTQGKLHYSNWWGGAVFAPFAIIVGAMVVVVAIRWKAFKNR